MSAVLTRARIATLALAVALLAALAVSTAARAATAEQGDSTGVEKWASQIALNEVGQVESPLGSDYVANGRGYGDFYDAWCGDFMQWVLEKTGIPIYASGRPSGWNFRLARQWSIEGWKAYGRVRAASTRDAMPGDIVVHNDSGNGGQGGHVSMVVKLTNDPRYVWTVGGNESNGVRLRKTDLLAYGPGYDYPRKLVTITEMRFPSIPLKFGTSTVGSVQLDRIGGGYGPLLRVHQLKYGSTNYTAAQINTYYRFRAIHRDTGAVRYFNPMDWISTINYRDIRIERKSGYIDSAVISYPGVSLSGKPVSSTW